MWILLRVIILISGLSYQYVEADTVNTRPELPQNDVYNNKVERLLSNLKKTDRPHPKIARQGWDMLNKNNARSRPKSNEENGRIIVRGPPGPRGPPGAQVTKKDMIKEFKKMVKAAAERKARKIIRAQCPSCKLDDVDSDILSLYYPGVKDRVRTINKAPVAFTAQLLSNQRIQPGDLTIVKNFQLSGSKYRSIRGVPANFGLNGSFVIQRTGIYQFVTTLNFHSGHKSKDKRKKQNYLEVKICPNTQCAADADNRNLIVPQYRHSMSSRQRYFTVQLTAQLELKKGDSVSIAVNNLSRRVLTVQQASIMSGVMISV